MRGTWRYDTSGNWYKGNVHLHSTYSDGGKTPTELAELYAQAGYSFLSLADHWVEPKMSENPSRLLWLNGVELDGKDGTGAYYHIVSIGHSETLPRDLSLEGAINTARKEGGILILAHPNWCGNSIGEALRYEFDGVEVYNHVCHWLNGKGESLYHWDMMLEQRPDTLGFAVDDVHLLPEHPGWNGGWIVANAPACTREKIMDAIKTGNFYSSCGPAFHSIEPVTPPESTAVSLHVRTSPVSHIRLVGPRWSGKRIGSFEGEQFSEATFEIPQDWTTARVEIEDENGRRAWTNQLFKS